jgi:hypothetical protein
LIGRRRQIMPQKQDNKINKDAWDKADIVIKGIGIAAISGVITLYGIWANNSREREAEINRKAQLFVQTMSNRETSESNLRAKMFEQLMNHYFEKKDEGAQLLFLKLIALNFQEYLNVKPLFEHLDKKLTSSLYRKELRKVAKDTVGHQIVELEGSGGEVWEPGWLEKGKVIPYGPLKLELLQVNENSIRIRTLPEYKNGFEVTYFDMPYVDNSVINAMRYSIVLSEIDLKRESAKIKIVIFPGNYLSPRDRPRMDCLITELLNTQETPAPVKK